VTSAPVAARALPLPALLSQALVAFTVEFDNAAELAIPNRTTSHGQAPPAGGVWLVSMAMWLNCMRYVGAEPITLGELATLARTGTNLDGMRRWGYVAVDPGPGDSRYTARHDGLVLRATKRGHQAREIWQPLTGIIEQRWRDRFSAAEIDVLRAALEPLAARLGPWLPDSMPILGYGLYSRGRGPREDRYREVQSARERDGRPDEDVSALALPWLLARALLALAIDYERESRISLAIAANLLRVVDEHGVRLRDLPHLTGVSKESIAMATGFTERADVARVRADPGGGRWKVVQLSPKGKLVRDLYEDRLEAIEERWQQRFGSDVMAGLRASLERLAGTGGPGSPLFAGLEPAPGNWRADVQPPRTLPHFPMVLHRGGFPDGS
jgi:DNA-binding MarR family transcriptional regulator